MLKGKGSFAPVIRSDLTLDDVVDQLDLDNVGALVVTDDNKTILGIITERDIARGLKTHGRGVVDKSLRDLMTKEVISVDIVSRYQRSSSDVSPKDAGCLDAAIISGLRAAEELGQFFGRD